MSKNELSQIKKAIMSTKYPEHTLSIRGTDFSCEWDGKNFIWTAPSGTKYTMSQNEVIQSIGSGEYIESYCFDYVFEPTENE